MNLSARLRFTVRLKQAKAKRISALENFQPGGTRLAEIGVEQSEILINPKIEKSLKNLRGVFTIYKPPHTHPDQVKREIDSTLLQYFNDEQGDENVPSLSLISLDGSRTEIDRRFDARAETPKSRLDRIGLNSKFFPPIGYHSSGLTFCSIGNGNTPEEQFLTRFSQRGQYWKVRILLGISTGEPIHPDHLTDKSTSFIIKNNLFTVDSQVLARLRQRVDTTPWVIELSLRNALRQIANEAKYKLYEKYMYEYGSSDTFLAIAAKHQEWMSEFNTTSDTKVVGGKIISFNPETNEAELYLHVLGNPVHHFFGVFGDYLTKTVLRVNSVVISSQRLDVGGGAASSIPDDALTHYEYTEVSDIKNSVKATRKYCRRRAYSLTKRVEFEKRETNKFITERRKLAKRVQADKKRVEQTTEYILLRKIQFMKFTALLDNVVENQIAMS